MAGEDHPVRRGPYLLIGVGAVAVMLAFGSLAFTSSSPMRAMLTATASTRPTPWDKHASAVATPTGSTASGPPAPQSSKAPSTANATRPGAVALICIPRTAIRDAPVSHP